MAGRLAGLDYVFEAIYLLPFETTSEESGRSSVAALFVASWKKIVVWTAMSKSGRLLRAPFIRVSVAIGLGEMAPYLISSECRSR